MRPERILQPISKSAYHLYDFGQLVFDKKEDIQSGERNSSSKLTKEQVQAIKVSHENSVVLGRKYGVSSAQIRNIKLGKTWKHL